MELPLELELAIRSAPDDREGYSVAADWLQQAGAPQGELVALSLAHGSDEIIDRMIELKHDLLPVEIRTLSPTAIEWRWGFVRGVSLSSVDDPSEPRVLRDLLASPIARFVQKIVLHQASPRIVDALLEATTAEPRALRCVRTLMVEKHASAPLDLDVLSKALPSLRRVHLWVERTRGALELPELHELGIYNNVDASRTVADSVLPALESLAVSRGEIDLRHPNRWLAPARLPALRSVELTLEGPLERSVWRSASIATQLEQLDVFDITRGRATVRSFVIDRRAHAQTVALLVMVGRSGLTPGTMIPIEPALFRIGRAKRSHLVLEDRDIAMRHAELGQIPPHWYVRGVEQHHVDVNGHGIDDCPLRPGDELALGGYVFRFLGGADIETDAAQLRQRYAL